jgi:hypothetical protein
MPSRYPEWLQYVFDHPITTNGWYFDLDLEPFDAEPVELVEFVLSTLENCGRDLAGYSNDQLRYGLSYMLDSGASDVVFALMSDDVSVDLRLRAINSIKHLYSDLFDRRCAPVLGHTSEAGGDSLNYSCYMLWDVSPLSYWERSKDRGVFYAAVCDVLEHALRCANRACVESALHGLGHTFRTIPTGWKRSWTPFWKAAKPDIRSFTSMLRQQGGGMSNSRSPDVRSNMAIDTGGPIGERSPAYCPPVISTLNFMDAK